VLAERVREKGRADGLDFSRFDDHQMMTLQQYNLVPNVTVVIFPDLLSVVRSRPGPTPDEGIMDTFAFERRPAGDASPRTQPMDVMLEPGTELPIGMVLNQDVKNAQRAQRGLHQPGLTHLTLSREECRIVNLHRNLEAYLGITPSEITGDEVLEST
jgi:hypothetical protein